MCMCCTVTKKEHKVCLANLFLYFFKIHEYIYSVFKLYLNFKFSLDYIFCLFSNINIIFQINIQLFINKCIYVKNLCKIIFNTKC